MGDTVTPTIPLQRNRRWSRVGMLWPNRTGSLTGSVGLNWRPEPMVFTNPCCKVLKMCLEFGDDRTFHRATGNAGPLMVRTMSSLYQTRGGQERQLHEQAVIFCPFCGTQLQTPEDVERYMRGDIV